MKFQHGSIYSYKRLPSLRHENLFTRNTQTADSNTFSNMKGKGGHANFLDNGKQNIRANRKNAPIM
jgi:hypothetical protein